MVRVPGADVGVSPTQAPDESALFLPAGFGLLRSFSVAPAPSKQSLAILVVASGLLAASVLDPNGLRKARRNETEVLRLERENASLSERVARLRREVKALQGDPSALERAAREELGFVKPGEVVYDLEDGSRR